MEVFNSIIAVAASISDSVKQKQQNVRTLVSLRRWGLWNIKGIHIYICLYWSTTKSKGGGMYKLRQSMTLVQLSTAPDQSHTSSMTFKGWVLTLHSLKPRISDTIKRSCDNAVAILNNCLLFVAVGRERLDTWHSKAPQQLHTLAVWMCKAESSRAH